VVSEVLRSGSLYMPRSIRFQKVRRASIYKVASRLY